MPALFYKKFWCVCGEDVIREVKKFLDGGEMPEKWNETVVVLIPKVLTPEKLKDLRPISLCNVIYKVASKVLANRLKLILPDIIAPNQSAFVPGRLIMDNVLIANELSHFMQNKRRGAVGYAALKLDMSKANRVEWRFLEQMMEKLGFHEKWRQLIMKCITTLSYRIKVNGELTDEILPTRGLRQGDPLSPYLVLLCADGFSTLLNATESSGALEGVSICRDAPSITHLLFANDSLLLLKVNDESAHHLRQVLQLYENCSGQIINKDKSSIMFRTNTKMVERGRFMEILDIPRETRSDKYLGLPVYIDCSKTKVSEHLKQRVWKRIQGWKERFLSRAGKETLIKSTAQAIPTYAMSCFDITKSLCDDISMMINRFW